MLKNYLKVALRNLRRHKGYALINVLGLAVGMACCLLIGLYVFEEWSYDRHHERADRIARVTVSFAEYEPIVTSPSILAPLFKQEFPEVQEAVRLFDVTTFGPVVVQYGSNRFQEEHFLYGDSTLFDVFTFSFLRGHPETALSRPGTVVLTETTARTYFGHDDPLGKTITVDGTKAFEITGVIEDVPPTSHLQFDFMASLVTRKSWPELSDETWRSANFLTYVLLRDEAALASLEAKIPGLIEREFGAMLEQSGVGVGIGLQRLTEIHLYHEGHIAYVYLFSAIALLVLVVACANYMNLATARSMERAKEVGVRKAMGARRAGLVGQFLAESVLATILAASLALLLAELALPVFREISGKALPSAVWTRPPVLFTLFAVIGTVGLLAGSYPALFLSRFRPAHVLKGTSRTSGQGVLLRKGLVVFQFAVVVVLLAGTMVIYRQLDFVQSKNLGFREEQVLVLPLGDHRLRTSYPTLKGELLRLAGVHSAAALSSIPGHMLGGYKAVAGGGNADQGPLVTGVAADPDVAETLDLDLVAGPGFPRSPSYSIEQGYVYLLNETAARQLGWTPEEAIGKSLDLPSNRAGEVVGVTKDFHFASLHQPIGPLVLFMQPQEYAYLLVRMAADDVPGTLAAVEQVWNELAPHRPFEYGFLDQTFDALYRAERRAGQVLGLFGVFAILIASLGLFGLAAFTAEQRTKEIGVRKVLGASVHSIVALLSKDFLGLVAVAFVVAAPLAYLVLERWLEAFAYRVEVGPGVFVTAGLIALVIALATVSYQSVKAALADPVKALRYE